MLSLNENVLRKTVPATLAILGGIWLVGQGFDNQPMSRPSDYSMSIWLGLVLLVVGWYMIAQEFTRQCQAVHPQYKYSYALPALVAVLSIVLMVMPVLFSAEACQNWCMVLAVVVGALWLFWAYRITQLAPNNQHLANLTWAGVLAILVGSVVWSYDRKWDVMTNTLRGSCKAFSFGSLLVALGWVCVGAALSLHK